MKNKILLFFLLISLTGCNNNLSDSKRVRLETENLSIPSAYLSNLKWDIPVTTSGKYGCEISWSSSDIDYIDNNGKLLKFSSEKTQKEITLTAFIKSGEIKSTKKFNIKIASEDTPFEEYLFAYFEGSGDGEKQEQLRFGVSQDAKNWEALNNNNPILPSRDISQTGGIRDPHILRSENNESFMIVATDMFTRKNGWGHNPGIVMLRSDDLINWKHSIIDLERLYPERFSDLQWMWAPQTIYDPEADKYMVYFTVKFKYNDYLDFYYAYANENFDSFVSEPQFLYRAEHGAIDGDIIYKDGTYHLLYKGNTKNRYGKEFQNGIKQATSKSLKGPWTEHFNYLDCYWNSRTNVEGSSVFKLNDSDEYILMYDLYSSGRYEFQRSKDLFNFSSSPESFNKNFHPRHGSVIGITKEEADRLRSKWGSNN